MYSSLCKARMHYDDMPLTDLSMQRPLSFPPSILIQGSCMASFQQRTPRILLMNSLEELGTSTTPCHTILLRCLKGQIFASSAIWETHYYQYMDYTSPKLNVQKFECWLTSVSSSYQLYYLWFFAVRFKTITLVATAPWRHFVYALLCCILLCCIQ